MQINGKKKMTGLVPSIGNTISDPPGVRLHRVRDSSRIRSTVNLLSAMLMAVAMLSVIPMQAGSDYEEGKREWDAGRPAEALAQWQAAAGSGDRRAMLELGRLYRRGFGVVQDFIAAHMWLNLAAARGDIEAFEEREALAAKMTVQQLAEAQDLAREWTPASSDVVEESTEPDVDSERVTVTSDTAPETIQDAQTLLAALGYEPGDANGEWNARSKQAYTAFLQDSGLPHVDDLTAEMLLALHDAVREQEDRVDSSASESRSDSLIQAVLAGDIDRLTAALDSGANVNTTDSMGMTALIHAVMSGDARMIESLLEVPSLDVDARADNGMTALLIAVAYGQSEVIEQLMQAGADFSVAGPDGRTAVDLAKVRYGDVETLDVEKENSAVRALQQGMSLSEYEKISADQAKLREEQEVLRQLQAEQEKLRIEQEKLKAEREKLRLEQDRLAEQKEVQERLAEQRAEQERVRLLQAEQERLRKLYPDGKEFRDCDSCPMMVVVPAGSFLMGSPISEKKRDDDEGPVHRVTIPQPFAVGRYEVTFDQWDACVSDGGCSHVPDDYGWGRGNRPVVNVNWYDAGEYVDWLSHKTGKRYRLLSEAEWEYAARAGTRGPFHFGETISTDQANYNGNLHLDGSFAGGLYRERTVSVGSFPGNAFGLHDVHGNVSELVEACWHGSYDGAPTDGSAWTSGGNCNYRVVRGGSWSVIPWLLRSANRGWVDSGFRFNYFGFRVARTLAP